MNFLLSFGSLSVLLRIVFSVIFLLCNHTQHDIENKSSTNKTITYTFTHKQTNSGGGGSIIQLDSGNLKSYHSTFIQPIDVIILRHRKRERGSFWSHCSLLYTLNAVFDWRIDASSACPLPPLLSLCIFI